MLQRYFDNGCMLLQVSKDTTIKSFEKQKEMLRAMHNMELIEAEVKTFDKIYYGNRQVNRRGLTAPEYAKHLELQDSIYEKFVLSPGTKTNLHDHEK